ncbi:MAG: hypothetical protein OEY97_09095 [Nitrospirota bacterium]|nr:hypothetical protein [Nitrospirota bacterium]
MGVDETPQAPQAPDVPRVPRVPRPGDPFAGTGSAPPMDAVPDTEPKKKRKKGRTFFLVLLFTGAALVLGSLLLMLTGRNLIVNFYKDYSVQRGIPEALAADVPVAEARALIQTLDAFFDAAGKRQLPDEQVLEMIHAIEEAQADRVITRDEAAELARRAQLDTPRTVPGAGG